MIAALYFDGRSSRGRPVQLTLEGDDLVAHAGDAAPLRWPRRQVRWPERVRHGQRVLHLQDGGSLQVADAAAFDAWRRRHGLAEGWVVRLQQDWQAVLVALLLVVAAAIAGYRWGIPWAARALVAAIPEAVDREIGAAALDNIQHHWLQPSQLPAARQAALGRALAEAVAATYPPGQRPSYRLLFFAADDSIGPNAFALPGGSIVVTDALVALLQGHDDTLVGVLGHELGHVRHRDGMRALAQGALAGTVAAAVLGDFSSVVAAAPVWLAQLGYSRDAERAADAEAVRVLRASGRSPAVMAVLFERLPKSTVRPPIALATHPLDDERVRYFQDAAAGRRSDQQ